MGRERSEGGGKEEKKAEGTHSSSSYLLGKALWSSVCFYFFLKKVENLCSGKEVEKKYYSSVFFSSLLAPGIATSIHASPPSNSLETGKRKLEECVSSGLCKVYSHLN